MAVDGFFDEFPVFSSDEGIGQRRERSRHEEEQDEGEEKERERKRSCARILPQCQLVWSLETQQRCQVPFPVFEDTTTGEPYVTQLHAILWTLTSKGCCKHCAAKGASGFRWFEGKSFTSHVRGFTPQGRWCQRTQRALDEQWPLHDDLYQVRWLKTSRCLPLEYMMTTWAQHPSTQKKVARHAKKCLDKGFH